MNKATLQQLAIKISSGLTPLRSNINFWNSPDIPWVKTEQLGTKNIFDSNEKVSQQALDDTGLRLYPKNTISVAMYGEGKTRGSVSILKNEMTTNQACCNIELDKKKADYEYVYYYLTTQYNQLRNLSSGVRKNLNSNDIKNFEIRIPEKLDDQRKIASVLSSLDTKIELNNRINAELEAMAKTLYDYWFVQFDFPDEQGKPYKSSGGKMVYNKELKREIPEGWEVGNVLHRAELFGGGTPKTNTKEFWNGEIPFFTPSDVEANAFSLETEQYITQEGLNSCSSKLFEKGTVFLTARGTVGRVNIASDKMAMNQSCYAFYGQSNINYPFVYFYINELAYFIKSKGSGSVFKAIVSNDIKYTEMLIPPIEIISKYNEFATPIFEKILLNKKQNQQLASLRDWLLPMLMNGQVTVRQAHGNAVKEAEEKLVELDSSTEQRRSMAAEPETEYKTNGL